MSALDRFSLEGRRALVTGAGRGIGAGIATALAEAGAQVALVARTEHELAATAAAIGERAVHLPADVAGPYAMRELVTLAEDRLGGVVDTVVHAAGVQHRQPAEHFRREEWDRVLAVNVSAPFFLSQEIGRRQLEAGVAGSHVFIGSIASAGALNDVVAYTASKSAVWGVVRNLSLEWSGRGIRVNGIGPAYVRTAITADVLDDPERSAALLARIPMGRFGEIPEVASAAVFLASDAASFVTGQLLMVDGGWSAA